MASALLRPNADVSNQWAITDGGATQAWQVLDEVVTQPTAPGTGSDFISESADTQAFESHLDTVTVGTVIEAKLWVYAACDSLTANPGLTLQLREGANVLASTTVPQNSAAAWRSATYTGNLTQAQVNDLRVRGGKAGALGTATVYAAYVELTYSPIAFGAVGATYTGTGTSHAVAYPTGIAADHLLVLIVQAKDEPVTNPSGWTQCFQAGTGVNPRTFMALKKAVGTESGTLTVTTADTDVHACIIRYTGVDTTTPQDAAATSTTGTDGTIDIPSITTVTAGAMLVMAGGEGDNTNSYTGPGTERKDWGSNPSGAVYDQAIAAAGATGTKTLTVTAAAHTGGMIALRPASSGLSATLGQNTETDLAQPMTSAKVRELGQNAENDTAQPMGAVKTLTLGLATEADEALPIAWNPKNRLVGILGETNTPLGMGSMKTKELGLLTETDEALPLVIIGSYPIGLNTEADQAQPMSVMKTVVLGLAQEADEALAMSGFTEGADYSTYRPLTGAGR